MHRDHEIVNQESDFGTPETQKQGGGITKGYTAEGGKVAKVNHQNPIDMLLNMGKIDDKQYKAAEILRQNAKTAGKFSFVKSSADFSVQGNKHDEPAEWVVMASQRYNNAISMLTNEEKSIVIYIVIEEGYIRWISNDKLRRTAMPLLRQALDVLIKFYRI